MTPADEGGDAGVLTDAVKITALGEHPRRPGRYRISLAGAGEILASVEMIAELKLKVGRELSGVEVTRLQGASRLVACYDKALATLGARARSAADLARWLKTKEFTDAEIVPTVEKLQALGLLDDLAFARTFARARLAPSRGFGLRRVAAELARKGVARSVVDHVLAEVGEERDAAADEAASRGEVQRSAVEEAAAKKLRATAGLPPDVQRRRLFGFLARRGFSSAEIAGVIRRIGTETAGS